MPSSKPTFSICIPCYNTRNDYLDECLRSVETQLFHDWEIILVDDGSSKNTTEYIRTRTTGYSNIRVIYHQQNMGLYATRTDAIEASEGTYLLFLDSDDAYIGPDVLGDIYNQLQKWDPDILLFNMTSNLSSMQPSIDYHSLGFSQDGSLDIQTIREVFFGDYVLNNMWNKVFKRKVFELEEPIQHRLNMCEDRFRFAGALFRVHKVALYNKVLYFYRVNHSSLSRQSFCNRSFEEQMYTERFVRSLAIRNDFDLQSHRSRILKVAAADLRASAASGQGSHSHFQELVHLLAHNDLVMDAYKNNGTASLRLDEKVLIAGTMKHWPIPIVRSLSATAQLIKLMIQR